MFYYGASSSDRRDSCHDDLIFVMNRGLELSPVDISIIRGWSGKDIQDLLYATNASEKKWPDSKHNVVPKSVAFDFAPWVHGIDWDDTHMFALVAGCFFAAAKERDIKLRWGGDWDMDGSTRDQNLMDWGHIELIGG